MSAPWSPPPGVGPGPEQPAAPQGAPDPDLPGQPVAAPDDAGRAAADGATAPQVEWRRMHRITPFLNAWKVGAVILGIAVYNSADDLARLPLPLGTKVLIVVGLLVLGSLLGLLYGEIAWRRAQYGLSEESVFLHSGVLWRQQRHLRLDRLQSVDVTQPLLARIFGFAQLKIESAGGGESNLTLAYLTEAEAQRLRNELLARAAGVRRGPAAAPGVVAPGVPAQTAPSDAPVSADGVAPAPSAPVPEAPAVAAPERGLLELPAGRLVGSLVLSIGVMIAVVGLVAYLVFIIVSGSFGALAGVLPALLGAGGYVWSRFAGEFAFRVGISADGLRLRHGLLEAKSRTVPPGRVQAIMLTQPRLWRRFGWWRLHVNIAGYGPTEETSGVLYPVATTQEVATLLPLVLPDLGTDRPLDVLRAGMTGDGDAEGFVTSSARARRLDPLVWRRTGFRVTDTAVLIRTGRWWRSLVLVPHERTQSMALTSGPLERRLGLAGFALHSTPGRVTPAIAHLDVEVARDFVVAQAERARRARRTAGPERWMQRGAAAPAAADTAGADLLRSGYAGVLPTPGPR